MLTMPPEGTDLVLTSNVPDGEGDVLIFDGLNVEALNQCEYTGATES